jgi:hypothetical protein
MFCRSSLALRKSGSRTVPGAIPDLPCADAAGPFETRTFAEDVAIREVRHAYLLKEEVRPSAVTFAESSGAVLQRSSI